MKVTRSFRNMSFIFHDMCRLLTLRFIHLLPSSDLRPNDVMGNTPHNLVLTVCKINNGKMDGQRRIFSFVGGLLTFILISKVQTPVQNIPVPTMALALIMETIPSNAYVLPVSLVIAAKSVSTKVSGLVKVCLFVFFFSFFRENNVLDRW